MRRLALVLALSVVGCAPAGSAPGPAMSSQRKKDIAFAAIGVGVLIGTIVAFAVAFSGRTAPGYAKPDR